jgi:hypothetical protein
MPRRKLLSVFSLCCRFGVKYLRIIVHNLFRTEYVVAWNAT